MKSKAQALKSQHRLSFDSNGRPILERSGTTRAEEAYVRAAALTGLTPTQLKEYALRIFGSMLLHAVIANGATVWTQLRIREGRLDLEVNAPPQKPKELIEALQAAVSALGQELAANPDDDHPIILAHRKILERCERAIANALIPPVRRAA